MSGEPKTLTPAKLAGRLRLGAQAVAMTGDAPILWLRESRQTLVDLLNAAADKLEAVGVPVVARDEASELKAENERMRKALDAADSFISHEYHRNGHRLTDKEWAGEVLRQVEAITRRRLAGGENQK